MSVSQSPHPALRRRAPLPSGEGSRVTAVLGPTNTGKTHLAVERMLGYQSGIMGLPLRLLAREVYDRICKRVNARDVALITGEEKILPPHARYFICTVESMPMDRTVEFVAIDEIQLAADRDRGHVFTARLLHARGEYETMFLGADSARPLIRKLLPDTEIETRPRFSQLTWAGSKKLTRLPRRSAIVAFSSDQVYAIAELVRRQRGGAAVVMGALSPRTRNAQVELYQNGDVDFLIATDAIGMGLNMDVDHVAFAQTSKFDGKTHRPLHANELAQIAGRAGRYQNNGTFGVTGEASPLDPDTLDRIEQHHFDFERVFMWRNPNPTFANINALIRSLDTPASQKGLTRVPTATDQEALLIMSRDEDIKRLAAGPAAVKRLWEVAQIPDFQKIMIGDHASLLMKIYIYLMSSQGHIPQDWIASQVKRLDRTEGGIDTLSARIAHTRTWTYIAHRSGWLNDHKYWQERTRALEDKLSDALHERLTQRFIDRRTSVLLKRLRQNEELMTAINENGEVLVEGEFAGKLDGFTFVIDQSADGVHGKAIKAASLKALAGEIIVRADRLGASDNAAISLSNTGHLIWEETEIARLVKGETALKPRLELIAGDQLTGPHREKVVARLETWLSHHIEEVLKPLMILSEANDVAGLARGVAFQLVENLGHMKRQDIADDIKQLDQTARGQLRKHGVRFGAYSIFMPLLLKPAPARLLLTLWALTRDVGDKSPFADFPEAPSAGLTSVSAKAAPAGFYDALGFRVCGTRAVRIDMLERLADLIRPIISDRKLNGAFAITPDMMSLVGCSGEEFAGLLKGLDYRPSTESVSKAAHTALTMQPELKKAAEEAAATPAPEKPVETSNTPDETKTDAAPETDASEANASETPAPETPIAETTTAETPTAEIKPDDAPAAPEVEMFDAEVWRPSRRRHGAPSKHNNRRSGNNQNSQKADGKSDNKPRKGGKKPPHKGARGQKPAMSASPRKTEKAMDPDSPFAALMALKNKK
ncbi:MAG: ATP-dependent RNA helicase SUPV3L1/SUV3 [Parvibaculaceae bacterium]|jgi:ATP-dependent RNA helicase SUPV3L1/SUV3